MSTDEPADPAAQGLHINPLEFLAIIINLWLALKIIGDNPLCLTGSIIDLLSDNTTALSWMHVAATKLNPELQQLARFASALLVASSSTRERERRSGHPQLTIEEWASSYVGTRYFAALPAEDMSNLPTPARTAIHSSFSNFLTQDRGHVRQGNDGTADSRFFFCQLARQNAVYSAVCSHPKGWPDYQTIGGLPLSPTSWSYPPTIDDHCQSNSTWLHRRCCQRLHSTDWASLPSLRSGHPTSTPTSFSPVPLPAVDPARQLAHTP
jgi:hypothetical protein